MTGMLQNYARKHNIPINTLTTHTEVVSLTPETAKEPPQDGVYVYGMFMENARWDTTTNALTDAADGESITVITKTFLFSYHL